MPQEVIMEKPVYHRVLLKISGEALAGDKHSGLDFEVIGQVCDVVKKCLDMGVQVGLVVGGGNFWRGAKNSGGGKMERSRADHIGMLATVMNCLAVADVCEQKGIPVRVQTAIEMRSIAEPYIRSKAIRHLEKGRVVIFGAGTGNPYFSTDTAAVLANHFIMIMSVVMVGMSYQMPVSVGVIQGGGDTKFSMYTNLISTWGIVMPLSFLAAFVWKLPVELVVAAVQSDQLFKGIPVFLRFRSYKWIHKLT